jgi:hypothetical protein
MQYINATKAFLAVLQCKTKTHTGWTKTRYNIFNSDEEVTLRDISSPVKN